MKSLRVLLFALIAFIFILMPLEAGKISLKSPIGAALMGKKVGEIAEARVPTGTLRLRIESITLD